jgi:hypothetical protein
VTFSNAASAATTAAFSEPGVYVLRLSASDTESTASDDATITVVPANLPPVVNAGPDLTVTLPATAMVNGSVFDDGLPPGSTVTLQWSKVTGPGTVTFGHPNSASTTASFSEPGAYVLRLTASDTELTAGDDTTITVQPANQPPMVDAGPDLTVHLPATATLNGAVTDDGLPPGSTLEVQWSTVSGPGTVTFSNPHSASTTASFSAAGSYVLRLAAGDSEFTISDDTSIVVHPVNQPPAADAGPDLTVYLPAAASLNGTVTDDELPPGSTLTIQWSAVSGPGTVTFSNAHSASTTASFSDAGSYVVQLSASDTEFSVTDATTITVVPVNQPPVVTAGPDQAITLPGTAVLSGAVTDDGLPAGAALTMLWSTLSGPGAVTFANPNMAATTAAFSEPGDYVLRLTANDTEFTGGDDVAVAVAPQNLAPIADAGADFSLGVTETAQLDGRASFDPNGDLLTFSWTFVSIPPNSVAALSTPTTATPSFVIDRPGAYVIQLVVSDGLLNGVDVVTVTSENTPPVADAGPDQTAAVTSTVTLDAAGSSDVDGDTLTYEWTLVSSPSGSTATLSDPTAIQPTFVVDEPGTYELHLVVRDGLAASDPDAVVISTVNSAPVANAGPDQTVQVTHTVSLNGASSSDVDGDVLAFFWNLVSAPDGSVAVLDDHTSVTPTFVADAPGTYVVELVVHDGTVPSTADTVTIVTTNSAPVANAGMDQSTFVGHTVDLDGSGSTDADGDPLTYAWSLISVPEGSTASLSDLMAVAPSFVADIAGTYIVQLIVSEPNATSAPDTVTITTRNSAPVANAGPDQTVVAGQTVFLDGSGSSDVDGDPLTYQWSLTTVPAGSTTVLVNPTGAAPSFMVDTIGTFVVQLMVNDGTVNSAPDTVTVNTTNSAPVANAGPDQLSGRVGTMVTLDGAQSSDADGHALTYVWALTTRPAGSAAFLAGHTTTRPTFTPDLPGDYVAQLTVNDGFVNSPPDTVLLRAAAAPIVTIVASDPAAAEAGLDPGAFTVTRAGDTSADVIVLFTVGGSATPDVDYVAIPQSVTLLAGQPSAQVVVTPVADSIFEGPETVVAALVPNPEYALGLQTTATVTIAGEQMPTMTLSLVGSPVVGVGKDVLLQTLLSQPAPAGGVMVTITSDDTTKLTVGPPATAAIPAGSSAGLVTLNGIGRGMTTVRGTATGYSDASLDVVVSNNTIAAPITLNVPLGQVTDFPIIITREPANLGEVVITIVSDNPAVVVTTPAVTIPAGGLSANAVIFGQFAGAATLTSTSPNFATDTSLVTTTAHLEMLNIGATATMTSGFARPLTVQLESPPGNALAAPAGGIAVTVTTGHAACLTPDASPVLIAAGTTTTIASVSYGGTAALPCTTTVTMSGPEGVTPDSVSMTVNPAPAITLPTFRVGGGLQTVMLNATLGDANHGGVTVHLVSNDPGRVLLGATATSTGAAELDIPVLNGVTTFSYNVQGVDWVDGVSTAATVTITASATGFATSTGTVSYERPVLDIINIPATTSSLSANSDFVIRIGVPTTSNTMQQLQARRWGAPALVVTVTNGDPAVAEIDHNGGVDGTQVQTATIPAGQSSTPNDAAGGFEFDPQGVGSTTVSAAIPNFLTLPAGVRTVQVTGPSISMPGTVNLGGGLQHGALVATLGASQHGGVIVHLESSDPARVKLARDHASAGTDTLDITVNNGFTQATFYVQAADWVPGTSTAAPVTVTASATGFSNGVKTVNYVQPVLDFINLGSPTTSLSANTDFHVRIGTPTAFNVLHQLQARRFGAPPLQVTVTNGNAAVAEIDHNGGIDGAQVQTATINPGQSITPNNVAGGFEFDPFGVGVTVVTASIPGFITLPAGAQTITVNGPGISMPLTPVIGGGLQNGAYQGNLGGSSHGGVTVHLESGDPTRILLARDGTSIGAAAIDVPVANGSTQFLFFLQATDWVDGVSSAGPVPVTASVTGFTNGTSTVHYVRPGVDIINLPESVTALSTSPDFVARVGIPLVSGAGLQTVQPRRFGAPALTVTVTNSNPGVAEIDHNGGIDGAQVQTSSIGPGQSGTPNGSTGGFEFDPFGTGITIVQASIPNFLTMPTGTRTVTVSTPAITMPGLDRIGGGLMHGAYAGQLGATQHGGVDVHLVSSDPSRVLLGATPTSAGAAEIDVHVNNGANAFNFYVVGTDWTDGVSSSATVTITATASGFSSDASPITYVRPAVDIGSQPGPIAAAAANDDFTARVGVANSTNTAVQVLQWRRPGGSPLVVTVTNSNAAVAEIDLNGGVGGAQSQTASIAAGQTTTPFNTTGGFEFDPLGAGTTSLLPGLPGFTTLPAAGVTVMVTP